MNSVSGFFSPGYSTRHHLANGSAAGPASLVDGPLLGCVKNSGRERKERGQLGWGLSFDPRPTNEIGKNLSIFQIFSKFQTNLNSNQIYNFDDFHLHNKI
jgi:hypothetical protein